MQDAFTIGKHFCNEWMCCCWMFAHIANKFRQVYKMIADEVDSCAKNVLKNSYKSCNWHKNLYTLWCNGSPAGSFAIVLYEPRQDRKVATVVDLWCAGVLLVGLPPLFFLARSSYRF